MKFYARPNKPIEAIGIEKTDEPLMGCLRDAQRHYRTRLSDNRVALTERTPAIRAEEDDLTKRERAVKDFILIVGMVEIEFEGDRPDLILIKDGNPQMIYEGLMAGIKLQRKKKAEAYLAAISHLPAAQLPIFE